MTMKMLRSLCRPSSTQQNAPVAGDSILSHDLGVQPASESIGHHLVRLGDRAHIAGRFGKALLSYKRALRVFESEKMREVVATIMCLNKISQVCREQGLYNEAEFSALRALSLADECLDDDSDHTVAALNNLGAVYQAQEKYNKSARRRMCPGAQS